MEALLPDSMAFVQMALFFVTYVVLDKWVFGPYMDLLDRRDGQSFGAAGELEDMSARVDTLQQDLDAALTQARRDAARARSEILQQAQQDAQAILGRAQDQAKQEVDTAKDEIRGHRDGLEREVLATVDNLVELAAQRLLGKAA